MQYERTIQHMQTTDIDWKHPKMLDDGLIEKYAITAEIRIREFYVNIWSQNASIKYP